MNAVEGLDLPSSKVVLAALSPDFKKSLAKPEKN
jgi:hypothetical protein